MDAASVDNVVVQYLKKRGYAQAEAALKAEAKVTGVTLDDLKNRSAPPGSPSPALSLTPH